MPELAEPTVEDVCRQILASGSELVEISEFASRVYMEATGSSRFLAAEWAESRQERILKFLLRRHQQDLKRGVPVQYEIKSSGASEYVRLLDIRTAAGESQPREVLEHSKELLHQLTDDQFERLGALLIEVYGSGHGSTAKPFRTQRGNDGGFDFGGVWESGEPYRLLSDFACRIAGQAKNWSSPVPLSALESYFQRLEDLRRGHIRPRGFPSGWLSERRRPVLGMFLGRSGFQSSCIEAAKAHWTILIDGDQAAADLVRNDRVSATTGRAQLAEQLDRYS